MLCTFSCLCRHRWPARCPGILGRLVTLLLVTAAMTLGPTIEVHAQQGRNAGRGLKLDKTLRVQDRTDRTRVTKTTREAKRTDAVVDSTIRARSGRIPVIVKTKPGREAHRAPGNRGSGRRSDRARTSAGLAQPGPSRSSGVTTSCGSPMPRGQHHRLGHHDRLGHHLRVGHDRVGHVERSRTVTAHGLTVFRRDDMRPGHRPTSPLYTRPYCAGAT